MGTVLYTDLNCPFCYATEVRLEALGLSDRVQWRGVEHEPDLPVPMMREDEELNAEVAEEVGSVRSRAPDVEIVEPSGKPNTARAIAVAAAAERVDGRRAADLRHALYRALWVDGADISEPGVLDDLAAAHGLEAVNPRPDDEMRVTSWRLDWERSPLRGVPLLVRDDGEILYGLKGIDELERFVRGS